MTNIGIILGSTRPGRVGHQVAEWVAEQGGQHDGIDVEVVDIDYLYGEWNNKAAGFVSYGSNVGGARAVEHLRLIAAGLQLAGVRTQVSLSLATDFAGFTTFTPGDRHNTMLRQLFTEVTAWTDALAPLRRP